MTQPLDRSANIPQVGKLDTETGEFWREHTFEMGRGEDNLSAYEQNRLFLNVEGKRFIDSSFGSGCDIDSDSRSAVAADFNRDGATDLLVGSVGGGPLRLFANRVSERGRAVQIDLKGVSSNRQGIGARLVATLGNQHIIRDLFPANGCLGQGPAATTLGVGSANVIDKLEIRWPTGATQTLANLPVDGILRVTEGEDKFEFTTFQDASRGRSLARQQIVALNSPSAIPAETSDLAGSEPVIGVRVDSQARAYPIRYLHAHQLCNDTIERTDVLVSYSRPAAAATVFHRTLKGANRELTLNFEVAGMIKSVGYTVLQDTETKSLWNPLTGQCIAGKLKGTSLLRIPALVTDWTNWQQLNRSTNIIAKAQPSYVDIPADNGNSGSKHVDNVRESCDPDEKGLAIRGRSQQLFIPFSTIQSLPGNFIAGQLDDRSIIVMFSPDRSTVTCHLAQTTAGTAVSISKQNSQAGKYVATDGSLFDIQGRCRSGPLKGSQLATIPDSTIVRWYAWSKTFPKCAVIKSKN